MTPPARTTATRPALVQASPQLQLAVTDDLDVRHLGTGCGDDGPASA
jgi:hypothetical protein